MTPKSVISIDLGFNTPTAVSAPTLTPVLTPSPTPLSNATSTEHNGDTQLYSEWIYWYVSFHCSKSDSHLNLSRESESKSHSRIDLKLTLNPYL